MHVPELKGSANNLLYCHEQTNGKIESKHEHPFDCFDHKALSLYNSPFVIVQPFQRYERRHQGPLWQESRLRSAFPESLKRDILPVTLVFFVSVVALCMQNVVLHHLQCHHDQLKSVRCNRLPMRLPLLQSVEQNVVLP